MKLLYQINIKKLLVVIAFTVLGSLKVYAQTTSFDNDKPAKTYANQYSQTFNTTWDGITFYGQWDAMDVNIFTSTDISAGYLQFVWLQKRLLISKTQYISPYILQTDIDYADGSNRGGVVIRANPLTPDQVQEPAQGDPGFNREGIAFYPSEDGLNMIIQFTGPLNGDSTTVTRILVPKPASVTSLLSRGILRIEDFGQSIYVYYNDSPLVRINLGDKSGSLYSSGTVYNSDMQVEGTFSAMEVEVSGKVSIAERDAKLRLYSATIQYNDLNKQTISFDKIGKKQVSDPPFTLSATSTSGLSVEFRIVSGPATLNGNTITLTGMAGMLVIAATQLGDEANYPANEVDQTIFIESPSVSTETEQLKAYGDSWVATDAIGRVLPQYTDCSDYRPKKYVGMFYWLWHAYVRVKSGSIKTAAQLMHENPDSPPFECNDWYWGEPEDGFYHPSDPWVIRRNLQLLADAGVDFVFFDFTNGDQGDLSLESFMSVAMDMYNKGIPVPKISFFLNESYNTSIPSIINRIYSHPEYEPLLFKWEGKPLLMADSTKCATQCELCNDQAIKDHFTWRKTWAFDPGQWNFLDRYPQDYFSENGAPEQMPVSKSQGAPVNDWVGLGASVKNGKGPILDKYWETDLSKYGYAFEEQWSRAHAIDPSIVCLTGWNELVAGAWPTHPPSDANSFMGKSWNDPSWRCVNPATCIYRNPDGTHNPNHGWAFIDEFNTEFNRDLEPMKGGYTDNYYYQMVSHIRKFKGMSPPEPISAPKTITIDGNFDEWTTVTPIFKDPEGDVTHRNFKNVNSSAILVNNTGRNDIIESRSTYDDTNIYFYVKTAQALTPSTDPNWMLLFIDVDRNKGTGWEGFDYVINYSIKSDNQTTVKQWDGENWINEKVIPYSVDGNELELSVPRSAVMLDKNTPEFYFHWSDNPQQLKDITCFFTDGESAPDRRFNYNYSTSKVQTIPQTSYKVLNIPGTIEFEDFDNGGAGVAYTDATLGNTGGAYRQNESVDIEAKNGGGYDVSWINTGEWLEYSVNVNAIGKFTASIHYAASTGDNKAILYVDDINKSDTIVFSSTGNLQTWSTKDINIQLNAGKHRVKFFIAKASGSLSLDNIEYKANSVVYPGDGTGLLKSLWSATIGGRTWFNDSICAQIDSVVDKDWGDTSPGCGINKDFWNARWTGEIQALYTETYTFYLTINDIGRLWINNQLIIDQWTGSGLGNTFTGTIDLKAGEKVPIKLDFGEKQGDALIKLEWSSPSNPREVVPQYQLFPSLITGINQIEDPAEMIKVYPNPSSGDFFVDTGNIRVKSLKITESQGQLVYKINSQFMGKKKITIDGIAPGLYLLQLNGDDFILTKKLILKK